MKYVFRGAASVNCGCAGAGVQGQYGNKARVVTQICYPFISKHPKREAETERRKEFYQKGSLKNEKGMLLKGEQ